MISVFPAGGRVGGWMDGEELKTNGPFHPHPAAPTAASSPEQSGPGGGSHRRAGTFGPRFRLASHLTPD